MKTFFKNFLLARPGFIRLCTAGFALAIGFGVIVITPAQIALVIGFAEALFSYVSMVAYQRDIVALGDGQ